MADVSEIVSELEGYGVPKARANELAAELLAIGARAAVYRRETADAVAEVLIERQHLRGRAA